VVNNPVDERACVRARRSSCNTATPTPHSFPTSDNVRYAFENLLVEAVAVDVLRLVSTRAPLVENGLTSTMVEDTLSAAAPVSALRSMPQSGRGR